jgi:hypothetical protein
MVGMSSDVAGHDPLMEDVRWRVGTTLHDHLERMGAGSLFNLRTGLDAMTTRGPAGELVFRIPRRPEDRIEVIWRSNHDD